jgi:hypothetical protein
MNINGLHYTFLNPSSAVVSNLGVVVSLEESQKFSIYFTFIMNVGDFNGYGITSAPNP